jgi:hypothetical protein
LKLHGKEEAKRYICKPGDGLNRLEPGLGEVFVVDWNERIYDLGFKENWRMILGDGGNW